MPYGHAARTEFGVTRALDIEFIRRFCKKIVKIMLIQISTKIAF